MGELMRLENQCSSPEEDEGEDKEEEGEEEEEGTRGEGGKGHRERLSGGSNYSSLSAFTRKKMSRNPKARIEIRNF